MKQKILGLAADGRLASAPISRQTWQTLTKSGLSKPSRPPKPVAPTAAQGYFPENQFDRTDRSRSLLCYRKHRPSLPPAEGKQRLLRQKLLQLRYRASTRGEGVRRSQPQSHQSKRLQRRRRPRYRLEIQPLQSSFGTRFRAV